MDKRTYADRREYLSKATNIRRLRIKKKLVDLKGGVCQVCGYSKCLVALDFHHIEESTKEFELSQRDLTRAWEKIIEEAKNVCWYVLIVTEKFMPGLLCLIRRVVYW